ncbi:MAG: helix-hairpin-helix domain-containing protein [Deltaproteobacteria bacterium]|nr:helix-hairpin-helix domain-containing protein [Deltaproteobacteria bacterium]
MAATRRSTSKDELQEIPGVGPSLARDLVDLGYRRIAQLRAADPERMYGRLCALRGAHVDRCVLYVFRCAVYYARNTVHDPELLKWWNWKEKNPRP